MDPNFEDKVTAKRPGTVAAQIVRLEFMNAGSELPWKILKTPAKTSGCKLAIPARKPNAVTSLTPKSAQTAAASPKL